VKLEIGWVRGQETVGFNRPHTIFAIGIRGSGKSAFLEYVAQGYLGEGHTVLDLFGSRDGEGLAWLRSSYAEDKKILLVCGDNVDVKSSFDVKNISKLNLSDFENYDIVISSSPLYSSPDDEFLQINKAIDVLYKRLSWRALVFLIVREAGHLYYSRLRVSANQLQAKTSSAYLIQEARHCGLSLGLDTLKWTSIDPDIRVTIDYEIYKSQGITGFAKEKTWMYGYFNPVIVRHMPRQFFLISTSEGNLGIGRFPCPPWHKQEKENIVRAVGLKIDYGDQVEYSQSRGVYKTVGDQEHTDIITGYMDECLSMGRLAKKLNRSAATIHTQIHAHNESIDKMDYCVECRRLKGKHEAERTDKRNSTLKLGPKEN
jgi:hypothetical protein